MVAHYTRKELFEWNLLVLPGRIIFHQKYTFVKTMVV